MGDGIGNGDVGEAAVMSERIVSDSCDGIGDSDAGGSASASCQMGLGAVGINQVPLLIAVHSQSSPGTPVCCAVVYNILHTVERMVSDNCDGIGDGEAGEGSAISECILSDRGD